MTVTTAVWGTPVNKGQNVQFFPHWFCKPHAPGSRAGLPTCSFAFKFQLPYSLAGWPQGSHWNSWCLGLLISKCGENDKTHILGLLWGIKEKKRAEYSRWRLALPRLLQPLTIQQRHQGGHSCPPLTGQPCSGVLRGLAGTFSGGTAGPPTPSSFLLFLSLHKCQACTVVQRFPDILCPLHVSLSWVSPPINVLHV